MLSFACKSVRFDDLLKCSFDLNKTDYEIFLFLLDRKYIQKSGMTVNEIAKHLKKERTVIQKSIKRLFEKNLIRRFQLNLEHGGYRFYYSVIDKKDVKNKMLKIINSWSSNVEAAITRW